VRVRPTWVIIALVFTALVAGCGSPSPSPLPSVGVQPAPNPKLVEFEGHVAESTKRQGQLVQALAKASNGAPAELNIVARQIAGWAAAEMQWLDQHRPDACYMSAADAYRAGVRSILSARVGVRCDVRGSIAAHRRRGPGRGSGPVRWPNRDRSRRVTSQEPEARLQFIGIRRANAAMGRRCRTGPPLRWLSARRPRARKRAHSDVRE
jgi:hypothetical protein